MLKNHVKNTLFLMFILKEYVIFWKIVDDSLQIFDKFFKNYLKFITIIYIVSFKNLK